MVSLSIRQGDADTLTETVTGISSLAGYSAKMYIKKSDGTNVDTLVGAIATLTITYEVHNADSITWSVGSHNFETKVMDTSDHVYTLCSGRMIVKSALIKNPHTT